MSTKILFTLSPNYKRLEFINSEDIELLVIPDWPNNMDNEAFKVARKLQPNYLDDVFQQAIVFSLRQRFSDKVGPYLLTFDGEDGIITAQFIASILNGRKANNTLDELLTESKVNV